MPDLEEYANTRLHPCQTCGAYQCDCASKEDPPGLETDGDTLTVTLPAAPEIRQAVVEDVDRMILDAGGQPEDWEIVSFRVNRWQTKAAQDDEPTWLHQVRATCRQRDKAEWRMFTEALAGLHRPPPRKKPGPRPKRDTRLIVCMGDDQAPHINRPLHEKTCEALADMRPDGIVYMGDGLDFSNLGQWADRKVGTSFDANVDDSLWSIWTILSERLEAAGLGPGDNLIYLYGNHEERLQKELRRKLPQLVGLQRVPDGQEVLEVGHLAGLHDLGFETVRHPAGDYPHGTYKITDGLLATHGWTIRKGAGASVRAAVETLNSSLIVGHTHRLAITHVTRWDPDRPVVYVAAESGTMADLAGLGYTRNPDWQPGFLTVSVNGEPHVEAAVFRDGVLSWRDQRW